MYPHFLYYLLRVISIHKSYLFPPSLLCRVGKSQFV